jgi:RNA polymerase sigma factor (TIGR02999 family)
LFFGGGIEGIGVNADFLEARLDIAAQFLRRPGLAASRPTFLFTDGRGNWNDKYRDICYYIADSESPTAILAVSDVTRMLSAVDCGDPKAAEELLPLLYEELRKLAAAKMAGEAPGQTLQPTALVHEAWLRLTGTASQGWNGREHFFRAAAEAMRRILVDRARQRAAEKRGGNPHRTELSESKVQGVQNDEQILAVHEALDQFALRDPVSAELVKLRYFVGMSMGEAAESLGLPLRTAERQWTFAKAWLRQQINEGASR